MAKAKEKVGVRVYIPKPNFRRLKATIVGKTRLVTHRFPHGVAEGIQKKQAGEKVPKTNRDPQAEFERALYVLEDGAKGRGRYGLPCAGLKNAMASVGKRFYGIDKVLVYTSIFIHGEACKSDGMLGPVDCLEIKGPPPELRTDIVRLAGVGHTADLRYRPSFEKWEIPVDIEYDADVFSEETILLLMHEAGRRCGIGEGRMEKGGHNWGSFAVKGLKKM